MRDHVRICGSPGEQSPGPPGQNRRLKSGHIGYKTVPAPGADGRVALAGR
jgi:hypothetical protein